MMRWDIINSLILKYDYNSYLEIGTQYPNSNFNKINAKHKVSVEPFPVAPVSFVGTSDEYFYQLESDIKFDIIFIDGLHHHEQVLKDINNSIQHLSENGTIICHDCLPSSERMQHRDDHGGEWTGDVWKAIFILRDSNPNIIVKTINTDYGCCVLQRGNSEQIKIDSELSYEYYIKNRNAVLNIIQPNEFLTWINLQ